MNYLKFSEQNEHEGETWHFYLPIEGNETELGKLRDYLASAEEDAEWELAYELGTDPLPEAEVDILVKHADVGYMSQHNKVSGVLATPDYEADKDQFYKGGISDHFTAVKR